MGLNDFILNCEKDIKELKKDIEYYKNKSKRLEKQLQQREEVIEEAIEFINKTQYDPELKNQVYGINYGGTIKLLDILNKYKKEESEKDEKDRI